MSRSIESRRGEDQQEAKLCQEGKRSAVAASSSSDGSGYSQSVRRVALLFVLGLPLASCGKSDIVAVRRPVEEIRVCDDSLTRAEWGCRDEFNAGLLIGMRLPDAKRLAAKHGYVVRRAAPLQKREALTMDFLTDRIEVETDAPSEDSTVVRFIDKG
jgi:hypothetical protein